MATGSGGGKPWPLPRRDITSPWSGSRGGDSDSKRITAGDAGGVPVLGAQEISAPPLYEEGGRAGSSEHTCCRRPIQA